jgi:hypothetical protein
MGEGGAVAKGPGLDVNVGNWPEEACPSAGSLDARPCGINDDGADP